ncbi:MAG: hypothetical protein ACOCVN_02570 [bacterium]
MPTITQVVSMVLIFSTVSWFVFIRKKRYLLIYNRFKNNDPFPIGGRVLVLVYVVLSFAGIILAAAAGRYGWL